ncbi:small glutamine-rich tetratricopeptide repeat-containing protein beta [Eurosta solidaginis]|uniref:small glutamine-rich tetratricopeptide repeat-containing protein beta n=1 Tax=Eurosta solidaginis TaxID=178769 RepID=UPI0035307B2E
MADKVQKEFVRTFITFLRGPCVSQLLSSDSKESVDVAVQCLQTAFDIEDTELDELVGSSATDNKTNTKIDIFEVYQSLFIEKNAEIKQIAETYKNEGNRLMKNGKYNEALLQYNKAITFDPKNPIYYCNRAAAYIRLNNNESAITDCKTALIYNSTYSKAYGRLGIAYSNLKMYLEAQQAYEKAIELDPDNQDYRNNLEVAREAAEIRNTIPQITEGINTMLSTPSLRNIFNNADIDIQQLQILSQNPLVMNAVTQIFSRVPTHNSADIDPSVLPNGLMQLFQSFASQLSTDNDGSTNEGFSTRSDSQPPTQ